MGKLIGAIDAGGTTFKCAILNENRDVLAYERIPTTFPTETLGSCLSFFENFDGKIQKLGIACFGPLNLNRGSEKFGQIHDTPKELWNNVNPRQWFSDKLGVEVEIETDVNAALLAERAWGAAIGTISAVYLTVGTGIGAGIYANGGLLGTPHHPEFGHIPVQRHEQDQEFRGICSYHNNCLEGMASADAMWERFGDPEKLESDHIGWAIVSDYLAQACMTLMLTMRPERIILGGGLMQAQMILPQIQDQVIHKLDNYAGITKAEVRSVICKPKLDDSAGLFGGAYLALR